MIEYEDEGFYFDRIFILSTIERRRLIRCLPIERLEPDCRSFEIIDTDWQKGVDRSRIEVVAPMADFLPLIYKNEGLLGTGYKVSKMEIAHDRFCVSAGDASFHAEQLFRTIRKKYSFGYIFENHREKTKEQRLKDHSRGLFAIKTYYSSLDNEDGGRRVKFRYVIYARRSKMNNRYCVHAEWRIDGAGLIAHKTGIRSIGDFLRFDFNKFFDAKEARYIVHESIDYDALGRWVMEFDGRKILTPRQKIHVEMAADQFLGGSRQIKTYSDLVLFFKDEKSRIKKKRGVRSEQEQKVMALKDCRKFRILFS